jgi:Tol biopolymer transport system component
MRVNIPRILLVIVLLAATGSWRLATHAQGVTEAERQLQKAILLETVDGNLQAAIDQYKVIVAQNGSNRATAAKALLRLAGCYEKLGQTEAEKTYQQLINDYADQTAEVTLARTRLGALLTAARDLAAKPSFRQIRVASSLFWLPQLSPDGSKLAFAQPRTGDLWLIPIRGKVGADVAGPPEKLNVSLPEGVRVDRDGLAWSADGKWIAFNDSVPRKKGPFASGIYVVSSAGGVPRKLSVTPDRAELSANYRLALSPDGKQVAFASMQRETGDFHLEMVPVQGGPARRLTESAGSEPAYSPNGRLIAYVAPQHYPIAGNNKDRLNRQTGGVWVVPEQGGTPVLVADVKSQASYPVWSPDGAMIAFTAAGGVWVVPVSPGGNPTAAPVKFVPPRSLGYPVLGWTADNKIGLLLHSPRYVAVYTVPASGGQAAQVTPEGVWYSPKWAPDGKTLFLTDAEGQIFSAPAEGGKISSIPWRSAARIREPAIGGENAVSPDGRTIVFAAVKDGTPGIHLWTIPVEGGEPRQLTAGESKTIENRFPCWSPDARWVAFVRGERRLGDIQYYADVNIYRIPAGGGEPRPLTTASDGVSFRNIALSPDGNFVAYFSVEDNRTIKVKSLQTGASRVVGKTEGPGANSLAWSPDGKQLAFTTSSGEKGPLSRIRIVSLEDLTTVTLQVGFPEADYWHVSWSPDGKRLAFVALQGGDPELWLMEDFLPLIAKGR